MDETNQEPTQRQVATVISEMLITIAEDHAHKALTANGSPEATQKARQLLDAVDYLRMGQDQGDIEIAAAAALLVGVLLADVLPVAYKGKTAQQLLTGLARGGRPTALSNDEQAKAVVSFANLKDAGQTDNGAVMKVLRDINQGRNESDRVSKSTIERAVGVRQK